MSRIRVFELAKEAGIAPKDLADRLITQGFAIKSHSSTVDDATAEAIRTLIRGLDAQEEEAVDATAEDEEDDAVVVTEDTVVEKRMQARSGTTVIRRRHHRPAPSQTCESIEPTFPQEPTPLAPETPPATLETALERHEPAAVEGTIEPATPEISASDAPDATEKTATPIVPDLAVDNAVTDAAVQPRQGKSFVKIIKRGAIVIPEEKQPERGPGGGSVPSTAPPSQPADAGVRKDKRIVHMETKEDEAGRRKKTAGKGEKGSSRRRGEFESWGEDRDGRSFRKKDRGRKKGRQVEPPPSTMEAKAIKKRIKVFETISVGDLAHRMGLKVSEIIAKLMGLGIMATLNQALDVDTATILATDFGYEIEQALTNEQHIVQLEEDATGGDLLPRPPVVTVMGHVDHGKTSILDAIRKTDVAGGEAGGITQHIGAHYVHSKSGDVVFLDTPGHAAFTEMRSRGAKVTDIVVLVVAADDGVMDQTKEAINHARAAGVPIVVAVNKIDKPDAQPDRVMRELADLDLLPEDWGGQTIYCQTSAKQNLGIDELLENIHLQAEILELKADPNRRARGRVIEAQLHKGRGPVATVLVQEGTLKAGDYFVIGEHYGKVRALINDRGETVTMAGPSMPVEIQGISGVPGAGDDFSVVPDEKIARNVSGSRQIKSRESELASRSKISLENLFEQMGKDEVKELRVVLRTDVQGSLEAFGQAIRNLSTETVTVNIIHEGTGTITESDVLLASASNAIIIGFNIRPTSRIKEMTEREGVDFRFYDVIYHALEDIQRAMVGMLSPTFEEQVIGRAEVRQVFKVPKIGTICGSFVLDGKIVRNARARVIRDGVVIFTGKISSLRRFKDDAREVASGYECGIGVENFNDIKAGDHLECFIMEEKAAEL